MPADVKVNLLYSLVYSCLTYTFLAWGRTGRADAAKIECAHRRALNLPTNYNQKILSLRRGSPERDDYSVMITLLYFPLCLGVRIQPTPALRRVLRGDYLMAMSCPLPPANCMPNPLALNGAYELGKLGTGLSWFR